MFAADPLIDKEKILDIVSALENRLRPQLIKEFGLLFRSLIAFILLVLFSKLTVYVNDIGLSITVVWTVFAVIPSFLKIFPLIVTVLLWSGLGFLGLPILPYQIAVSPFNEPSLSVVLSALPMVLILSLILYPGQSYQIKASNLRLILALLASGLCGIIVSIAWFVFVKSGDILHGLIPVLLYNGIPIGASMVFGYFMAKKFAILRDDA